MGDEKCIFFSLFKVEGEGKKKKKKRSEGMEYANIITSVFGGKVRDTRGPTFPSAGK